MTKARNVHIGSTLDDFLKKEGIHEESQAQAIKEVVAWQLADRVAYRPFRARWGWSPTPRAMAAT